MSESKLRELSMEFSVDKDSVKKYSETHSLCACDECRNFYAQARDMFPKLTEFLSDFGILIERPDEIASLAGDNEIDYLFVAYTVTGEILESDSFETDLRDGNLQLKITIDNRYVPNTQETDKYFTITIENVVLPWILGDPFARTKKSPSIFNKIKKLFDAN